MLDGSARPSGRVIISDWGGDPAALDCAELLAAAGCEVTLAVGAVMPGETVHQYARNQYLGRLARAGVTIADRHGLVSAAGGEVEFANMFAPELRSALRADVLVLSHGRRARGCAASSSCAPRVGSDRRRRRLPLAARLGGGDPGGHAGRARSLTVAQRACAGIIRRG